MTNRTKWKIYFYYSIKESFAWGIWHDSEAPDSFKGKGVKSDNSETIKGYERFIELCEENDTNPSKYYNVDNPLDHAKNRIKELKPN